MTKAELVTKLRSVMPEQSTVDITRHAQVIANAVLKARALSSGVAAGTGTAGGETLRKPSRHATPDQNHYRAIWCEDSSPTKGKGSS